MSPDATQILMIVAVGGRRKILRGCGRDSPPPVAVARWDRLPEDDLRRGRFSAVFYESAGGPDRAERLQRLKRLARGLPLLPFRLESAVDLPGRAAGKERRAAWDPGTLALAPPLDPGLLGALAARERLLGDLRQRVRRSAAEARDQGAQLQAHAAIVRATGNELDPHRIIDLAMERVRAFFKLRAWLFLLADPEQGILRVERTGGEGSAVAKSRQIGIGEGIAGRAVQKRQPVLIEDVGLGGSGRGAPELPGQWTTGAVVAVPLLSRGRVIGVVEVLDRRSSGRFQSRDARILSLLLEPAAVAVDNALLLRRSEELSVTDDLTKLYNSRYLNATLRREVERSKRYRTPVSLIFLDLDGFKCVNDQHGHLWGSRTLVEVGQVIGGTVREIDVVSRFGGDEFTVILPQTGPEGAQTIAERIRQRIAETTFLTSYGLSVRITASVGIASFPDHGRTKDDLIARADEAMYLVKGRGKNGVALAEPGGPRAAVVETVR
jgi:diguanylate cyclase (GGDEF)-like protein